MEAEKFGQYIQRKRKERRITLRRFAELADVSFGHLCDIENGNRPAPKEREVLDRMAKTLNLDCGDAERLYDLAAKERDVAVPEDVSEYVKGENRSAVVCALRTARDMGAGVEEWEEFIRKMTERRKGND
jgi:transcriptional regulator with XRE-family HTH domain